MTNEGRAKVGLGRITTKGSVKVRRWKKGQSECESEEKNRVRVGMFVLTLTPTLTLFFVARRGVEPLTSGL